MVTRSHQGVHQLQHHAAVADHVILHASLMCFQQLLFTVCCCPGLLTGQHPFPQPFLSKSLEPKHFFSTWPLLTGHSAAPCFHFMLITLHSKLAEKNCLPFYSAYLKTFFSPAIWLLSHCLSSTSEGRKDVECTARSRGLKLAQTGVESKYKFEDQLPSGPTVAFWPQYSILQIHLT